jgi:RNA polymerase sigma-70 factor (ECF subfamily)
VILSAREGPGKRRAALEELLVEYWRPLYFYVRRKGRNVEQSKDVIQGFIGQLLQRDFVTRLDPSKGRFRSYLRAALDNYLANEHERDSAQKRGGNAKTIAMEFEVAERGVGGAPDTADLAYEREWALGVMERAIERLRKEFEQGVRTGPFDVVVRFFRPEGAPSYAEAAAECDMTESRFKAFIHRARVRFRSLVREEVSHTVPDPADVDDEIAELIKALSR